MQPSAARQAGFDLICLYGAHGFGVFQHFLSRATNQRTDEYGGSLENRSRFAREVIADMRDAVGDTMALTLRVSLDETIGNLGFSNAEVRDFVSMNAELPDLWDLAMGSWEECSGPSRFKEEAAQEVWVTGNTGSFSASRCGRWQIHIARRDGANDQVGKAGFHRLCAALDRRTPSSRKRLMRGGSRISANASAATSASPAT